MTVRSVERAVAVVEFVARNERPAPLHAISDAIDAPKSTALNILRTLAGKGWLAVGEAKTYTLGPRLAELAGRAHAYTDIRALARPHLEHLARRTGEAVFLSIVDGDEIVYIDAVESTHPIRYAADVGSRRPLHCTSAGKVALALSPADVVERYIAKGLARYTAATITDPARLRAQLRRIRARGYGDARGERVPSLFGVAGPVVDPSGQLVAAVTVAGPAFRIRGHEREISGPLRDTVTAISRHLTA
jgi:IclR family acetate operon transcriptional repressor